MAEVKSNMLPKVIVFGVLATAIIVGLKACSASSSSSRSSRR
ncbi:hypothetical protein [Serratia nevei]|nr:hypothetical protein [Serratia nevei]MDR8481127.1 hypothetical protein [Serratia nevei]